MLLQQHRRAGSFKSPGLQNLQGADIEKLVQLITSFTGLYRPHEAREDTVLFPAFRKLVSHHDCDALGEDFEKNEHNLFGRDGFETMMGKVLKNHSAIDQLSRYTRQV